MNLDNYFARYLNKTGRRNGTGGDAEDSKFSTQLTPVQVVRPSADSSTHGNSPGEAAQSPSSPNDAASSKMLTMESEEDYEVLSQKRLRIDVPPPVHAQAISFPVSATASSLHSPTYVLSRIAQGGAGRETQEDEEDELNMLLGSQKAREVKALEAEQRGAANTIGVESILSDGERDGNDEGESEDTEDYDLDVLAGRRTGVDEREEDSGCRQSMSSLGWDTTSNRKLDAIAEVFARQFEFELFSNSDFYNCFEPFFRDRVMQRIERVRRMKPCLERVPTVTPGSTGALPGCALRDYQIAGVQFLLDNFHRGMSCILSDDMGLGKTAQMASFLHTLKLFHGISGPHLIVAPLSTLTSWTRELSRWAPQLRVVKYHGKRESRQAVRRERHNRHTVVVTTPAMLGQDRGFFQKRSWVTVIVDEAHVLKGVNTQITRVARKLPACFRVAVTGTPVHNNVREVWNLMGFLYPSLVAGFDTSIDGEEAAKDCAALLQHIMLRRTKETMELGIPPRVDEPVTMLNPSYVQLELLSTLTAQALQQGERTSDSGSNAAVNAEGARRMHLHLSHQRAVCNHPMTLRLLSLEERSSTAFTLADRFTAAGIPMDERHLIAPSAKMVHLDGLLKKLKAEGHRVLIFSNFTATLDLLEAMCHLRQYSYERLDGSCNRVERELSMLRFNPPSSSCFVFLVTTTAGGVGVTLTGADTVVMFDANFNPQLDRQAADRAHRIGQTRTVHVYRLCLRGTVEEHIRDTAERKASLGDFIVDGGRRKAQGDDVAKLTAEEIRAMFRRFDDAREEERRRCLATAQQGEGIDRALAESGAQLLTRTEEDEMVEQLALVDEYGLPTHAHHSMRKGVGTCFGSNEGAVTSHKCFVCGDIMHSFEPLYHCNQCPKAFHGACIGEKVPAPGAKLPKHWTCPRHTCSLCGKGQDVDGAIFMCVTCPRSFCFDCLDPRYLVLNTDGTALLHVTRTYAGMENEGASERRTCYYLNCLHCCGVLSSSSSDESSTDDSDEDNDDADVDGLSPSWK